MFLFTNKTITTTAYKIVEKKKTQIYATKNVILSEIIMSYIYEKVLKFPRKFNII